MPAKTLFRLSEFCVLKQSFVDALNAYAEHCTQENFMYLRDTEDAYMTFIETADIAGEDGRSASVA